jgi:hypothetical protein
VAKNAVAKLMHYALVYGECHCLVFEKQEIDGTNPYMMGADKSLAL